MVSTHLEWLWFSNQSLEQRTGSSGMHGTTVERRPGETWPHCIIQQTVDKMSQKWGLHKQKVNTTSSQEHLPTNKSIT